MSRYANAPVQRSTCPWGDSENVSDAHTLQSEKANRRREANNGARPTVPWNTSASPKTDKSVPPSQGEIEAEKMDFIQQCFEKGMTEDQVYEALEQYQAPLREITGLEQKIVMDSENITLADKRAQKGKISDALVGKFDAEESRSAYLESQSRAAQARDRNRTGSGIF
eukprot:symbB.v1.2.025321.t1/scaffold2451.1/size78874/6